jgi:hypothetical protein
LASVEWEHKFPLLTVHSLTQSGFDNTSLLIDPGHQVP